MYTFSKCTYESYLRINYKYNKLLILLKRKVISVYLCYYIHKRTCLVYNSLQCVTGEVFCFLGNFHEYGIQKKNLQKTFRSVIRRLFT